MVCPSYTYDAHHDRLREACALFGILGHPNAAALTALGLHALQHRGQEAAGIVSTDQTTFYHHKGQGLVEHIFKNPKITESLQGPAALGHNRYSTTGGSILRNVQPLFANLETGGLALAHNGNLTNYSSCAQSLIQRGAILQTTNDSEVVLHLMARAEGTVVQRFIQALRQIRGAYAIIALTNNQMIGVRDPFGIRPLVLGERQGACIMASETVALDIMDARFIRAIEPGEMVIADAEGLRSLFPFPPTTPRPCIFEYVYFSRPDSLVDGQTMSTYRKRMGRNLALEHPAEADIVVPVPDSGNSAALGYAEASGIPFDFGIIRNHYKGRTFIEPKDASRHLGVRLKHNANVSVLKGQRVVLVDDSIVRGTTSVKIVAMLRAAGAREVHMRISSPPVKFPCFYGIDIAQKTSLLAHNHDLESMRQHIGTDSLAFLSIDGLYQALGKDRRDPDAPAFTDHYFTGDYPVAAETVPHSRQDDLLMQVE